ncbi:MAG: hypothetical protein A2Z78_01920 [Candidatus Nealsonbacteria bacterium RBG_13_36_15]|uniref:Uncharacterized protein n=1 Tax=Candidatus Nealsonbacteria bacterium RBG_13_36_15 TaxID=1801660 RepID=A0A1G2DY14_9BACT|nr:MAG: hypothetical protein A2Z78_01920 [Candidatus Nealsonbacteria bacterium RBG_13_36_15]
MKINKKVILIAIGILLLFIIVGIIIVIIPPFLFGFCGSFTGEMCPEGYFCSMKKPCYPDQSGTCFPNKFPFNLLK